MGKAGTGPKPKKTTTDKAQSERFRKGARKLGVDESGKTFEMAFKKIVPPRSKATRS
jgi:hypothetical protein